MRSMERSQRQSQSRWTGSLWLHSRCCNFILNLSGIFDQNDRYHVCQVLGTLRIFWDVDRQVLVMLSQDEVAAVREKLARLQQMAVRNANDRIISAQVNFWCMTHL